MFFTVANAVFDASIVCWAAKLAFVSVCPVTAVRWLFAGHTVQGWLGPDGGIGSIPGETWRPFQKDTFPTPPFPEYVSGHSTFSMAAAIGPAGRYRQQLVWAQTDAHQYLRERTVANRHSVRFPGPRTKRWARRLEVGQGY